MMSVIDIQVATKLQYHDGSTMTRCILFAVLRKKV